MFRRLSCALAMVTVFAGSNAHALVAGAVPGSAAAGFATPVVTAPDGGPLNFVNLDTDPHNFIAASSYGPNTEAWCGNYVRNKCPRFWSKTTTVGSEPATPVLGLENTPPGSYEFHCSVHSGTMKGTLVVQ